MRSLLTTRRGRCRSSTPRNERLKSRGLVEDGGFTASGREFREDIDSARNAQMKPASTHSATTPRSCSG
jgi:hypothetical protein